jgi:hypothetical protein
VRRNGSENGEGGWLEGGLWAERSAETLDGLGEELSTLV